MNVLAGILLVGILILVHELGHFLVARLFGVGVRVFSIGFGAPIVRVRRGQTDYQVGFLPLGGYVLMEGSDPFDPEGGGADPASPTSLTNKPVWQRLLVVAAGPAANLILPVLVFAGLYVAGQPQPLAVASSVESTSPAWAAGIRPGDRIVAVDGQPVRFWLDVVERLESHPTDRVTFEVERSGQRFRAELSLPDGGAVTVADLGLDAYEPDSTIGIDDPASPAGRAGRRTGDRIVEVAGRPVRSFREVVGALDAAEPPVEVVAERPGEGRVTVRIAPDPAWQPPGASLGDPVETGWGLAPMVLFIAQVAEGSAAAEGGLQPGDRILAIEGRPVASWGDVVRLVGERREGEGAEAKPLPVRLTLVREGRVLDLAITPRIERDVDALGRWRYRPILGILRGGDFVEGPMERRYYPPLEALALGLEETAAIARHTLSTVADLVTGAASPAHTLGGPVQIFRDASQAAERGLFDWARMMGMLSISLGIVNFLPVPVLDGGQFLFYLVEAIRGRPVSVVWRERAQQIGVLFLVALMLMVFVFDLNRALSGP